MEDDDNMFRFDYSREFLKWTLSPPGQFEDWLVGVRVTKTKKLVGFISGIPVHMRVHTLSLRSLACSIILLSALSLSPPLPALTQVQQKDTIVMTEINFLCVNKKLRAKRLAPVLIKEITRRVNIRGIW